MRAWIYARLSNDDDPEQNSLTNQLKLCRGYVEQQQYELIGSSTDDNISGMTFHRPGLESLTRAVESRLIDAIIVKDLSRLGRHRTQTALFIDYLRQKQVAVLSVTEKLNTLIAW